MRNANYLPFLIIISVLFVISCTSEKRYRTPTGLHYLLFPSDEKDPVIHMGQIVKYHIVQIAGDSVVEDTYDKMPKYWLAMPGFENRYNPLEVFDYGLRKGDSVITIQNVDTMVAKHILDSVPAWMKKGDEWITRFKVVAVFDTDSGAHADKQREATRVIAMQQKLGMKRITNYLIDHQLKAKNIGDSLYIEVAKNGKGPRAVKGNLIKMHFTLRSLRGKQVDSTHEKEGAPGPAIFPLGSDYMPSFVEKRLEGIPAGSRVKCYIPGVLLFGMESYNEETRIDDDWIIDMEILEVNGPPVG